MISKLRASKGCLSFKNKKQHKVKTHSDSLIFSQSIASHSLSVSYIVLKTTKSETYWLIRKDQFIYNSYWLSKTGVRL